MRGPTPKDPAQRQRRNKAATEAALDPTVHVKAPFLPRGMFPDGEIHAQTRRWWRTIWKSPMAPRWLEADVEVLYLVAVLRNQFYQEPSTTLASEIRQQETRVGLDLISRRRLDWRIEGPRREDAAPAPTAPPVARPPTVDPRDSLRIVS